MRNRTGIYAIRNIVSGRAYVGATKTSFYSRWNEHKAALNHDRHHNKPLQYDWESYGSMGFAFLILETIQVYDQMAPTEQRWIDYFRTTHEGCYNQFPAYEIVYLPSVSYEPFLVYDRSNPARVSTVDEIAFYVGRSREAIFGHVRRCLLGGIQFAGEFSVDTKDFNELLSIHPKNICHLHRIG